MSESKLGQVVWIDQATKDADGVRDFYSAVVGWDVHEVSMGKYSDYAMVPDGADQPAVGICHAKGVNSDLPPGWLLYVNVANLDASIDKAKSMGGELVVAPKKLSGQSRYAVVQDPGGCMVALCEEKG